MRASVSLNMTTDMHLHRCSFCDSTHLSEVMDFGRVALAGAFLKPRQFCVESKYQQRLYFCHDCFAVQIVDKIPSGVLFTNYFYFSSKISTLCTHFSEYAADVTSRFLNPASATVLEFGCNDGVLLRPLADLGIRTVIGVDPASNVLATIDDPRITVVNDYFTESTARFIVSLHGKVDLIMANNVYAHIPDIQNTTRAISLALHDDGVFVCEVHYLGSVINGLQFDMIYHEHLYYYSLLSAMRHFQRYNMKVFDVSHVAIHAGSIRLYVCKNNSKFSHFASDALCALESEELKSGFDKFETYALFASEVNLVKLNLIALLERLRSEGKRIVGYGASGRANTIIQYCGIGHQHLDYVIDDAPSKIGFYTPGSHFPIKSSSVLAEPEAPDYVLVFAWSFFDEIVSKHQYYLGQGGNFILPLPQIKIFNSSN